MFGFLDVIILHVRKNPNVAGILAERIAGQLTDLWSFEMFLIWIFGRHANRIEVEGVVLRFCEPKNGLVSSGQALRTMQAVFKMPDDPVSQLQTMVFEDSIEDHVQWKNFS